MVLSIARQCQEISGDVQSFRGIHSGFELRELHDAGEWRYYISQEENFIQLFLALLQEELDPFLKEFCVLSFCFVFVFVFIFFFTLSLLVCGIVDSSQCRREDLERKEVKQFVKLSCQPLHGGIRPTAKMNKLFQMHGNQRENNNIFWLKIFLFLATWLLSS